MHNYFVSEVNLYKNPVNNNTTANGKIGSASTSRTTGARLAPKRIVDTKLQQFFDYANNNLQKDAEFMRVWHGSAAVFDHFDGAFMLTGEGSMVYGAGHYVTNVKETGRMYAEE